MKVSQNPFQALEEKSTTLDETVETIKTDVEKVDEKVEIDPKNDEKNDNDEDIEEKANQEDDASDTSDASEVSDEKEDTSDTSETSDEDLDQEEIDLLCTYVLANHSSYPLYVSDNRADLVDLRSRMVQEVVAEYSVIGRCYVSFDKDENEDMCSISYMQRNLFWTTERTIDSYTIFRVPKI